MTGRLRAKHALARVVAALRGPRAHGVRILVYHSITRSAAHDAAQMTTPVDLLEQHLEHLLRSGRTVLSARSALERLQRSGMPRGTVVLTFDDGFADMHELVLPLLRRFGFPATVFVVNSLLRAPTMHGRSPYMQLDDVRQLARSGLVDIGSHGYRHVAIRGLDPAALERETRRAKADLEQLIDREVEFFAYPYGSFDAISAAARRAVMDAGFIAAMTGIAGTNTPRSDPFLLRRSRVSWAEKLPAFERLLSGAYDWYALVQRTQALLGIRVSTHDA